MPARCVRSAPSTSMTSVPQWPGWVSGLQGPLFVLVPRPFSWPPLPPLLAHTPACTGAADEAPERLCLMARLPGSSCSENLSQQFPACLPRFLHQCLPPAR